MLLALSSLSGCKNLSPSDNLSPKLDQKIGQLQGNQNTIENDLNSIKAQLSQLSQTLELQGNNNQLQQGWLNIKGDGIFVGGFALVTISMLLFYMWRSSHYQKTTEVLAGQIRAHDDKDLKERIMATAWNTGVERAIYELIK
jgi:hypothetical protein